MNVLVVPAIDWLAGPENRLHRIFHRLSSVCQVHCVHFDMGEEPIRREDHFPLHRPPTLRTSNLPLFYTLNAPFHNEFFRKLIRLYDIDVVVTSNLLAGAIAIRAAKREGIASVFDYVDYLPSFAERLALPNLPRRLIRVVAELVNDYNIRSSDMVIAAGELLRRHANKLQRRVEYVPNGVDTRQFKPSSNGASVRAKYDLRGQVVGYVGYIQFWVDLEPAIKGFKQALQEYPEAKFLIAGIGQELNSVKRLVADLGLRSNVVFTGRIDYVQVPRFLDAMDVCVLPFKRTITTDCGIPLKAHEYASMGKPIVSTPLRELVHNYAGAVITADSPQSYANAFLNLFRNTGLKVRMGTKARMIAESRFDWNPIAKKYLDCLRDATGGRSY